MEVTKEPVPVIRSSVNRKDAKKVESIIDHFSKFMKSRAIRLMAEDKVKPLPERPTTEDLLNARRSLVSAVEAGMLERKDQEEIIGILAAIVWFMRQEEDRQNSILRMW